jgi:hypothetical protein
VALTGPLAAQPATVRVVADSAGDRLQVDGKDFFVQGVNWDYVPIGQNYAYSLWTQPEAIIRAALDREMPLLRAMGVNAIRQYAGIPPRWVRYIYERHGIQTVLNHPLGRYGVTVNGVYTANTNYADPVVRALLTREVLALIDEFKDTPGVLLWLLGNENNYGLEWKSAETENLPVGERQAAKATFLYSLVGEVARAIKARDRYRPVALANGDLQYLDVIAREARGLDIFGSNVYRGRSFTDLFARVRKTLGIPVMFTEFGADAWNERTRREDQAMQARYLISQWEEIYAESRGKGGVGNAIGGFTFQWSDGWWKFGQESRLADHDINASWSADAYPDDYRKGANNMNEEWWGIMAKGRPDSRGLFPLHPRAAYYALQQIYTLAPYAPTTTQAAIRAHFATIDPDALARRAVAERKQRGGSDLAWLALGEGRVDVATFATGGQRLATPVSAARNDSLRPSFTGTDHTQTLYAGVTVHPTETFKASAVVNALGQVADNPIDEIFYEGRGRSRLGVAAGTTPAMGRLALYRAGIDWDTRRATLQAFYRTGHYHWGYEGDVFGLYREANYGRNIDIYNGRAPVGVELTGKGALTGLKLAAGPELWWGANPGILGKYRRRVRSLDVTTMYQEEFERQPLGNAVSSVAIPLPPTRRATLAVQGTHGSLGYEAGGIWAGSTKIGDRFYLVEGTGRAARALQDRIRAGDTFGGKARVTWSRGPINWYAQGALMGLVADAGPTAIQTFTGWGLKDTGFSDQWNVMSGMTWSRGAFQVAPNVLYQKPLVGPIPAGSPAPAVPRNVLDDPFFVRANREMLAGELLLTWDPTPASWFYQWDNEAREDAPLAANLGVTVRRLPTTMDAGVSFLADGRTPFAFPAATPPRTLWEVRSRVVAHPARDLRLIANLYGGTAEPNGDDPRLVTRGGGDVRLVRGQLRLMGGIKVNDFGPFDYHRDFNLTFPRQAMVDVGWALRRPQWFDVPETRLGMRGTWRSLNVYSPRFCPERVPALRGGTECDPTWPAPNGREWELRSYLTVVW